MFRMSHVASFQGRVACRFYPLEGLTEGDTSPSHLLHVVHLIKEGMHMVHERKSTGSVEQATCFASSNHPGIMADAMITGQ